MGCLFRGTGFISRSCGGGIAIKDTNRRILKTLFTNSLAVQYNYNGHGDKHAFGALTLKEVVNGMLSRVFISYIFLFICCAWYFSVRPICLVFCVIQFELWANKYATIMIFTNRWCSIEAYSAYSESSRSPKKLCATRVGLLTVACYEWLRQRGEECSMALHRAARSHCSTCHGRGNAVGLTSFINCRCRQFF